MSSRDSIYSGEFVDPSDTVISMESKQENWQAGSRKPWLELVIGFMSERLLKFEDMVGQGPFSDVYRVSSIDGKRYALKVLNKKNPKYKDKFSDYERLSLTRTNRGDIIRMLEHYETDLSTIFLFPFVEGMNLSHYMQSKHDTLSGTQAKMMSYQILSAARYLKSVGVAHLDIKMDNIMVKPNGKIVMIDFGLSIVDADDNTRISEWVGSKEYAPPEILNRVAYNPFLAMSWSIGVVIYCILVGLFPYDVDEFIRTGDLEEIEWPNMHKYHPVRKAAKALVSSLLEVNTEVRISLESAHDHEWFKSSKRQEPPENVL